MTHKTYKLQLVLIEAVISGSAAGEEKQEEIANIEILVNKDLNVAERKMYRIDRLITHAAFI